MFCIRRRAGDGRTIYIYIYIGIAHVLLVYVGLAQARPNEVTILNLHACCLHKNNCIWIDHIATDHASIEYEDKGLSRIIKFLRRKSLFLSD